MWRWTSVPSEKWLFSSHDLRLATRDSVKCRRLLESEWYQQRWGDKFSLEQDQNAKAYFENTQGGHRFSTAVSAGVTGEGGDMIVCDDPHNVSEAMSSASSREQAISWWSESMSTRRNDPRTGCFVVIMQRIHERDLSGYLLAEDPEYVHLCLPAEYEPKRHCVTSLGWQDPRKVSDELLWDPPYGRAEVDSLKKSLGPYAASGQLNQRPAPAGGGLLKREWWKLIPFGELTPIEEYDEIVQSWDLTFGGGTESCYTVGWVLGRKGTKITALDRFRERVEFPDQLKAIRTMSANWPAGYAKYIEAAANAKAAISMLTDEIPGLIPVPAKGNKILRGNSWSPYLAAGDLQLPADAPWLEDFLFECEQFPNGAYDDQVDAYGLGVIEMMRNAPINVTFGGSSQVSHWKGH